MNIHKYSFLMPYTVLEIYYLFTGHMSFLIFLLVRQLLTDHTLKKITQDVLGGFRSSSPIIIYAKLAGHFQH